MSLMILRHCEFFVKHGDQMNSVLGFSLAFSLTHSLSLSVFSN
uniref:Uncharacterized protein n=1 Tax=Rhizophora mucronata TaxID=61149 RepID=A0A2P2PUD4_RHIMU